MDATHFKSDVSDTPLSDRLRHLIGNYAHSDLTFFLANENVEIPAHKLIIATASSVFDKMIHGNNNFGTVDSVIVDDISKSAFMEILSYIYTDNLHIKDSNVYEILRKARDYELPGIEPICFSYLKDHLNISTVPWIYYRIYNYNSSSEFLMICLEIIKVEPVSVFATDVFDSYDMNQLKLILASDAINCSEIDLFKGMIKLARSHCYLRDIEQTGWNLRRVLQGADKLLRMETLSRIEFNKCVKICPSFFSFDETERLYRVIDGVVPHSISTRKCYTFHDADWFQSEATLSDVTIQAPLPPSCFYCGSFFICRLKIKNEVIPFQFHPGIARIYWLEGEEAKIEILCGSGYEWRKSNGGIPIGAVTVSEENEKPIFIGRGMLNNMPTIGPVYNGGKMIAYHSVSSLPVSFLNRSGKVNISEFEILVANNVKRPYTEDGIPLDAVFAGYNEDNLKAYVARVWGRHCLLPATVLFDGLDLFTNLNLPTLSSYYGLLRMDPGTYKWEDAKDGRVPVNSIKGGCTKDGETLYFGRVFCNGFYIPGIVLPSRKVLFAVFRNEEFTFRLYEVLVTVNGTL